MRQPKKCQKKSKKSETDRLTDHINLLLYMYS